jgi:hypothetical protein
MFGIKVPNVCSLQNEDREHKFCVAFGCRKNDLNEAVRTTTMLCKCFVLAFSLGSKVEQLSPIVGETIETIVRHSVANSRI